MSIPAPQPVHAPPCPGVGSPLGVRRWNRRLGECTATCPVCEWHFIVRGNAVPEHPAMEVRLASLDVTGGSSLGRTAGYLEERRWVGPEDEIPDRCAGRRGHP